VRDIAVTVAFALHALPLQPSAEDDLPDDDEDKSYR
jgi:hypothetical protein